MPKINENLLIFSIASLLFTANQLIEFLLIKLFKANYSDLCIWDCWWYSSLVLNHYDTEPHAHPKMDAANWAFFPFVPIAAKILFSITTLSAQTSLILTSKLFFLLAIYFFTKMVRAYSPDTPYIISGSIAAFNPYAIYGNVGYTESAFLLFSSLFFYNLKKEKFIAAAMSGAILGSVRFAGIFSLPSYLLSAFRKTKEADYPIIYFIFGALLIPIGLAAFMFYLYLLVGDALAFSNIQRAWGRIPGNPIIILYNGFLGGPWGKYWATISLMAILGAAYLAYKKMYEFAIFSILCTIIPLSTGLWAMPRYIFWQPPILFLIAYFLRKKRKIWTLFLLISTIAQGIMYMGWTSGKAWAI